MKTRKSWREKLADSKGLPKVAKVIDELRDQNAAQNLAALRNLVIGLCALDAARQHQVASYLPRFRCAARNNRRLALDLVSRPLLDKD